MNPRIVGLRLGSISGIAAAACFAVTPVANAAEVSAATDSGVVQPYNWTSKLGGVLTGFQSHTWVDESYSEVRFKDCDTSSSSVSESTTVDLRWRRSLQPDKSWGTKRFTNCFKGYDSVSSGEWTGLSHGDQFFQIKYINDSDFGNSLDVRVVAIDTTQAD
ncbi:MULTISPECIES: hypothetical protein [unclassified Streptomyces]|uniref:hypothetical protein n=1 Tax=unclassified Streptomyces TaxID=2593676 RepID=UPI0033DEB42B